MGDLKFRFRMGLFLAKPKKDPLTKAFLHGSLMEKAYDFDIPEDVSEIPEEHPDEIEGKEDDDRPIKLKSGSVIPFRDPVQKLYSQELKNVANSDKI